jgi:uncharacterized phage protein (TIGR01671 family)
MIPKFRAWDKETKTMNGMAEIYRNRNQEIELHPRDENIILMQSTGLVDKEGTEVFVGDIIKCTRGCPHEVYIEKEYGGTYIGGMPAIYLKGIRDGYAWTEHEEILGNIYENPELLEDKEVDN